MRPDKEVAMPRFFVNADGLSPENGTAVLRGADAAHVSRSLRMKPGEKLTLCGEDGVEYETVIESAGDEVSLRILSSKPSENEPPYDAVVYQGLARGDRFETVLMKATELGACRIVPVTTARCVVRIDPKDAAKKRERWQKIAAEAAGQSGRGRIPEVAPPMPFTEAVREAARADLPLFCYEGGGETPTVPLPELMKERPRTVSVMIGPEGGFEPEEAALAVEAGMKAAGLGRRILRTETAAPFVLSALVCRYELTSAGDDADG